MKLTGIYKEVQDELREQVKATPSVLVEHIQDEPEVKLTNLHNNKSIIVPLYAAKEVVRAVEELL